MSLLVKAWLLSSLVALSACGGSKTGNPGGAGGSASGGAGGRASAGSGGAGTGGGGVSAGVAGATGGGGVSAGVAGATGGGGSGGGGAAGGSSGRGGTAGGTHEGGASGRGGATAATGGSACEVRECKRPFECKRACDGPVESSSCCPCEPPLFDDFGGIACGPAPFCTGTAPRMVVNGVTTTPVVVGQTLVFDCCDGGLFLATARDFAQPIAVDWRVQAGASVNLPAAVDVGSLPRGWAISLRAGCNVTSAGCSGPLDNFSSGFTGSLSVVRAAGSSGWNMSLCMHFEEPATMPGTYVHMLDLYAPDVSTSN